MEEHNKITTAELREIREELESLRKGIREISYFLQNPSRFNSWEKNGTCKIEYE